MNKHYKIGGRIECKVIQNKAVKGHFKQIARLSVLACSDSSPAKTRPSCGDIVIGRVNRNIKQVREPALMIDFRVFIDIQSKTDGQDRAL